LYVIIVRNPIQLYESYDAKYVIMHNAGIRVLLNVGLYADDCIK